MSKARSQVSIAAALIAFAVVLPFTLLAQTSQTKIPTGLTTPDRVQTQIGALEFKDGAPSAATAQKVYDNLDYIRGVDAFMNSFSGASAYAIREGFHSVGAEDNTVVIFSELMDSNSLFLTANADSIYHDGSRDPMPPCVFPPRVFSSTLDDCTNSQVDGVEPSQRCARYLMV